MASSRPASPSGPSVSSYSRQVAEQDRHAAGVDPAVRRVRRQRLLSIAALAAQATLDDRELALGVRGIGAARDRSMEAHPMVVRVIDEREADPHEGLVGAQLDLHGETSVSSDSAVRADPSSSTPDGQSKRRGDREQAAHRAGEVATATERQMAYRRRRSDAGGA